MIDRDQLVGLLTDLHVSGYAVERDPLVYRTLGAEQLAERILTLDREIPPRYGWTPATPADPHTMIGRKPEV